MAEYSLKKIKTRNNNDPIPGRLCRPGCPCSAAGTQTKTYDYDAFGNEKDRVGADPNPFRYCGEYFDVESGAYYLRARYYDPSIGRFTQEDTH